MSSRWRRSAPRPVTVVRVLRVSPSAGPHIVRPRHSARVRVTGQFAHWHILRAHPGPAKGTGCFSCRTTEFMVSSASESGLSVRAVGPSCRSETGLSVRVARAHPGFKLLVSQSARTWAGHPGCPSRIGVWFFTGLTPARPGPFRRPGPPSGDWVVPTGRARAVFRLTGKKGLTGSAAAATGR